MLTGRFLQTREGFRGDRTLEAHNLPLTSASVGLHLALRLPLRWPSHAGRPAPAVQLRVRFLPKESPLKLVGIFSARLSNSNKENSSIKQMHF